MFEGLHQTIVYLVLNGLSHLVAIHLAALPSIHPLAVTSLFVGHRTRLCGSSGRGAWSRCCHYGCGAWSCPRYPWLHHCRVPFCDHRAHCRPPPRRHQWSRVLYSSCCSVSFSLCTL